jgi:hypothetical protein
VAASLVATAVAARASRMALKGCHSADHSTLQGGGAGRGAAEP